MIGSLALSHRLLGIFSESLRVSDSWATIQEQYSDLEHVATQVNIPGNDVFQTHNADLEEERMQSARAQFAAKIQEARASLSAMSADERHDLSEGIDAVDASMSALVEEAVRVFAYFRVGKRDEAAARMSVMDRLNVDLTRRLDDLQERVADYQSAALAGQHETAEGLRRYEIVLGVLIVGMVVGVTWYANRLARAAREGQRALETANGMLAEAMAAAERARVEAELANESKSRFLASMSHEIRTPLNGILGFAELLRRGADDGDARQRAEWVGIIHASGTHLLALLNDVLDLSKMDANAMDIVIGPCNPYEAISEAVLLMKSRADERNILLELNFDSDTPAAIRSDATRLRQIVMNLVSNAVKFTTEGGVRVIVGVSEAATSAQRLRIVVSDTGIGMTPQQMQSLFQPFKQADRSVGERFGGTGLGLAISRKIARRLGGDITVSSTPGVGSVFTAEIAAPPLLEGETLTPASAGCAADQADLEREVRCLKGRRILVADDVDANRKVCKLFLQRSGAIVEVVEDGASAISACRDVEYDLLLMDMQMPGISGLDAARRIRADGRALPIIALTAFSSQSDRQQCIEAGMNDFLSKPINMTLLLKTAAHWIRAVAPTSVEAPEEVAEADPALQEMMHSIAHDWLESLPERFERVAADLEEGSATVAVEIGHLIAGSGGTVGYSQFGPPARALEDAARAGDLAAAAGHLDTLRALYEQARESDTAAAG